jgi:S1/P1 nuclease
MAAFVQSFQCTQFENKKTIFADFAAYRPRVIVPLAMAGRHQRQLILSGEPVYSSKVCGGDTRGAAGCELAREIGPMRKIGRFLVGIAIFILCLPAFGWDDEGHMAVAYLAYQSLTPEKRARVKTLLKLNPSYTAWKQSLPLGTSSADADRMIFMIAATWPDQIRTDPRYQDDGPNNGYTPEGLQATQNIGYQDHLRHKYWHFIDLPYSQDGTPLPATPTPNIEAQIAAFRAVLASNKSDDVKSYDLVWLLHLVGDIHQPLHCVTRVTAREHNGDSGGNCVKLCEPPCKDTLHAFWDNLLGTEKSPAAAGQSARRLATPDPALVSKGDAAVWVAEGFQAAKESVYVAPIGPGLGPFTITPAYQSASRTLAKLRIALAGARLAKILNEELK